MPPLTLPFLEAGSSREEAELCVILLHGLGADGHDFADLAAAMSDAALPKKWRFVLPHAPLLNVTINMGMRMPAWYDILDLEHPRNVNWETVSESQRKIEDLLDSEPAPKRVLAGFSQGAALALHVGLRRQPDVAGILMMSGYLLESHTHPVPPPTAPFPIAIFHGRQDPVVPLDAAEQTLASLRTAGYSPDFKAYPGLAHSVNDEEARDVFTWLSKFA